MSTNPLIAICGTTGVGKSKLAVELALRLAQPALGCKWVGARVINADAMQVYRGFNVITNKLSLAERHGVEHLLMDFKDPHEQYIVGEWVRDAMQIIDETHGRHQVPVLVGGTSYWMQHLIFPNRLVSSTPNGQPLSREIHDALEQSTPNLRELFASLPDPPPSASDDPDVALALHDLLAKLDPPIAARWHWRDTRKVLRSLQIIRDSGRKASDIIKDQSSTTVVPRYRTLFLWLYADANSLVPRLNARVDEMLQDGVLEEVKVMKDIATKMALGHGASLDGDVPTSVDSTFGIFQSIGFKELNRYMCEPCPTERHYQTAVEDMKNANRKYAKRQLSWIRNKLLPAIRASNSASILSDASHAFVLDATDLETWASSVRHPAHKISEAFLQGDTLPDPRSLSGRAQDLLSPSNHPINPLEVLTARRKVVCHVCTMDQTRPVMLEAGREWEAHQRTKAHNKLLAKRGRTRATDVSTAHDSQIVEGIVAPNIE
ncbi:tRNA isopentenyltransferase [Auriscalpium vulgare]|uniref:tRNA isopentenyltransferase n=1 Tax=Auriscalpium vulgare TaxID=40419 RepID=A0ACB8RWP4_9AGAM|nr:tRNA isopentenyltransferase [Auriscalpium vulgare]